MEVNNQWANLNLATGKLLLAGVNSDRQVGRAERQEQLGAAFRLRLSGSRSTTVIRGGFGIFYNTQGNGSALFRLHRQLPFGPSYRPQWTSSRQSPARVQDGLPPIPNIDQQDADRQSVR